MRHLRQPASMSQKGAVLRLVLAMKPRREKLLPSLRLSVGRDKYPLHLAVNLTKKSKYQAIYNDPRLFPLSRRLKYCTGRAARHASRDGFLPATRILINPREGRTLLSKTPARPKTEVEKYFEYPAKYLWTLCRVLVARLLSHKNPYRSKTLPSCRIISDSPAAEATIGLAAEAISSVIKQACQSIKTGGMGSKSNRVKLWNPKAVARSKTSLSPK
ncbi:hypothetical protein B0T26DRAFT_140404 [Lasiosphaeria miniovina]|uniref:Ribosomal protein S7 n=1 Tax=Lasiosphaeria miniovina TaxID=1954250 RepID=A0AA40E771_9PEZI|nr:uncharacterized protein B0T26DRAFT_140404 [Lasiosphaeria miniovina]KAK0727582.1 hypothetical protein B0T26DRAFT_140404 [Lasiosphaeria miniovina]